MYWDSGQGFDGSPDFGEVGEVEMRGDALGVEV